jgi:hypothetical protein
MAVLLVESRTGGGTMGSRFHPYLVEWLDESLGAGRFAVGNGRHIVLNQFPKLMKESRLQASARVDADTLRNFLRAINPNIATVMDGSPAGLRRQLDDERDHLPALRKVFVQVMPQVRLEHWFVYTPPLETLRQSWRAERARMV